MVEVYLQRQYPPPQKNDASPVLPLLSTVNCPSRPDDSHAAGPYPSDHDSAAAPSTCKAENAPCDSPSGHESPADSAEHDKHYHFSVDVVDIYTLETSVKIKPRVTVKSGAAALVMQGYIRVLPVNPSLAISIKTLELYR
ncbi:hypothetical protein PHLCEN_2v2952 [Hermanssonia centrifuga]|uniref:Uncharacterized protein n=1 Tax=Hermanssonia centrifuga TaxID=98765 RepID=A0A2R6RHS1_9APHY|nr:hypothetical protein PHLCEN_2v2952 [Hermanssonia centrifuga]